MTTRIFLVLNLFLAVSIADAAEFFPADYVSARKVFREYSDQMLHSFGEAESGRFPVQSETDKDLSVDYVYVPGQRHKDKLIVLTSGVHGPEGFLGSAIQIMFMQKYLQRSNAEDTGVLIVHAMNPYGFKNMRRATEQNVNLNRNFTLSETLFASQNPGYQKLQGILEPKGPVESTEFSSFVRTCRIGILLVTGAISKLFGGDGLSVQEMIQAVGRGQYFSEHGIEYGGKKVAPQADWFIRVMQQLGPHYQHILHVDLHTGLGVKNALQVMTDKEALNENEKHMLEDIFGADFKSGNMVFVDGNSKGFYKTSGDITSIIPEILPNKQVLSVTAEFGTIGNSTLDKIKSMNRLVLENQAFQARLSGHKTGFNSPQLQKQVDDEFRELFHPADKEWRDSAAAKSKVLIETLLTCFK